MSTSSFCSSWCASPLWMSLVVYYWPPILLSSVQWLHWKYCTCARYWNTNVSIMMVWLYLHRNSRTYLSSFSFLFWQFFCKELRRCVMSFICGCRSYNHTGGEVALIWIFMNIHFMSIIQVVVWLWLSCTCTRNIANLYYIRQVTGDKFWWITHLLK